MINILFVDDERRVLDGLRRLLYPLRNEWEMHFTISGAEALDLLERTKIDIVVSDMMMPNMDGAELLTRIKELYPGIVRIILSGHSDKEFIYRAVGATHVYLSKPSERKQIENAIRRALDLKKLLANEKLLATISSLNTLPSLPNLYLELQDVLKSKNYSIHKVTEVVSKDVGMTAKILHLVNSAFFGLPRHVSNPDMAINLIGLDSLIALVMSAHIFSQFESSHLEEVLFEVFWDHCLGTATMAKHFAEMKHLGKREVDDAFAAGLLHDSGKIILMGNEPEKYQQVRHKMMEEGMDVIESEREVFGTSHPEVGAYLLGLWGLPNSVVEAVAFHHFPESVELEKNPAVSLVYLANLLERECRKGNQNAVMELIQTEQVKKLQIDFPIQDCLRSTDNKNPSEESLHE